MPSPLELIKAERLRQLQKGYTPEHDQQHVKNELAHAAACFAAGTTSLADIELAALGRHEELWPHHQWHPDDLIKLSRKQQLIVAGALILAELERMEAEETNHLPLQPTESQHYITYDELMHPD
ncbi:MAG: hypothetical protein KGQ58_08250 [Proteobacteria bacterium]|nr:hypothetical protein [Pseudomonadota bacterium]MDE3208650.1 hypothetical protein [Pseudomonadota bacterium]